MGGGGGKSTQSSVTKTDSENRYQTVNKVFDNAGNVYFNTPTATAGLSGWTIALLAAGGFIVWRLMRKGAK